MRRALSLAALALPLLAGNALAQNDPFPSLDLRGFRPPTAPMSSLNLEPTTTPGGGNWNAGLWASHAFNPVEVEGGSERATIVEHQTSMDYFANLGIRKRLAIGLLVPSVIYQTGQEPGTLLPDAEPLPRTALGDITFGIKATLLAPTDLGGFGLATIGRVMAPTGNPSSYISDEAVRGELRLLGELQLLAIAFRATAGAMIRSETRRFIDDGTDDFEFGHDLPWGAGFSFRPQAIGIDNKGRWRWTAEVRGAVALTPDFASGPQSPVLAGLSARYTVDEISAIAGVELPLNDAVGNPLPRPVIGIGWIPRFEDADSDGIEDLEDECPELAEDPDGFEDADGCPDFDDDDDGVPDEEDRCPGEKEDVDEFDDMDGCVDADNDGDTILDADDACPNEAGPPQGRQPGCPSTDEDGDGIFSDADQCPDEAEDQDGFQDDDGCPDGDNDGDGIADEEDNCPNEAGAAHSMLNIHGCPNPDGDGDTFDDDEDQCPKAPEDFDGDKDDDGCPDDDSDKPAALRAKPLVAIAERAGEPVIELREPIRFDGQEVASTSMPTLRALGQKLNEHPDWIVAVGVRPKNRTALAQQEALNRSFAVALALRTLTHRDSAAETLSFSAVQRLPGAQRTGVGLLLLVPQKQSGSAGSP